jgi:CBS-domain-containing membrane protein
MQARDVMTTTVVTTTADMPVPEAARLLLKHRISALPVLDGKGRLIGIVSEGDLTRRDGAGLRHPSWWLGLFARSNGEGVVRDYVQAHEKRVGDVMSREPISVNDDADVAEIARLLEERRIKRVPVLRKGKLVGIVSRADLVRAMVAQAPTKQRTAADQAARDQALKAIAALKLAPPACVNVIVAKGAIHLWGVVLSDEQAAALRRAVEGVAGGRRISDHLGRIEVGAGAA